MIDWSEIRAIRDRYFHSLHPRTHSSSLKVQEDERKHAAIVTLLLALDGVNSSRELSRSEEEHVSKLERILEDEGLTAALLLV